MTTAHTGPRMQADTLAEAVAALRARGLRLSGARRMVLEALYATDAPLSAEEIAEGIGALPVSDLASVYRNLETLERLGLVQHVHLGHGAGRYVRAGPRARVPRLRALRRQPRRPAGAARRRARAVEAATGYQRPLQPLPDRRAVRRVRRRRACLNATRTPRKTRDEHVFRGAPGEEESPRGLSGAERSGGCRARGAQSAGAAAGGSGGAGAAPFPLLVVVAPASRDRRIRTRGPRRRR